MDRENVFMLHAFGMGVYVCFLYDLFRILRRVIPHNGFAVSAEDFAFWVYCGVKVFVMMHQESDGTLRWFAILGAVAGMALYHRLVSRWFVRLLSTFFLAVRRCLERIVGFLFRPAKRLAAWFRGRIHARIVRIRVHRQNARVRRTEKRERDKQARMRRQREQERDREIRARRKRQRRRRKRRREREL